MNEFFAARVTGYDEHMRQEVEGCAQGYKIMARSVLPHTRTLLDLGCGTGLELDEIFALFPDIFVTGIDLTREMLDELKRKHSDRQMNLICGNYFEVAFGENAFDCAISFQSLHHFSHLAKTQLYNKIYTALKAGGQYIECDYYAANQADEDFCFVENRRIRTQQGIGEEEFYHFDTPCTIENQTKMLKAAGFSSITAVHCGGNTWMIMARAKD